METKSESIKEFRRLDAACSGGLEFTAPRLPEILNRPDFETRRARLSSVIAEEIVPRLHVFHHGLRSGATATAPSAEDVVEFGNIVMRTDSSGALTYFSKMRASGFSLDSLFLHLLQPTARYLDELWQQDQCDFVDVTIGVAHLQELLAIFESKDNVLPRETAHRVLLVACPEEQHLFGLRMVAKFMRSGGWDVSFCQGMTNADCCAVAAEEWFGILGLTLSSDINARAAAAMIETIKDHSANRSIQIMVGGSAFERDPELALRLGAHAIASDAGTAVVLAKKLLLATKIGNDAKGRRETRTTRGERYGDKERVDQGSSAFRYHVVG